MCTSSTYSAQNTQKICSAPRVHNVHDVCAYLDDITIFNAMSQAKIGSKLTSVALRKVWLLFHNLKNYNRH